MLRLQTLSGRGCDLRHRTICTAGCDRLRRVYVGNFLLKPLSHQSARRKRA